MSNNGVNDDRKQKLHDKYYEGGGKEKARQHYENNKDVIKEKARARYQNLSEEQKELKREYSRRRYKLMIDAVKRLEIV